MRVCSLCGKRARIKQKHCNKIFSLQVTAHPSPSIAVVIPNHNYGRYLAEAVDSVLSQSHAACQVIVVDDASTDNSREVLQPYAGQVELVFLPENKGQIQAYNAGFERVRAEVVVFLDSDDRLKPGALKAIAQAFTPGVTKVHWYADMIDAQGHALGQRVPHLLVCGDMRQQLLKHGVLYPSPPGSANAYATQALAQIMPLPQHAQERHGADFFTIYGSALLGEVATAGEGQALSDYRLHQVSTQALAFGNAAQRYSEHDRLVLRNQMFSQWVASWKSPVLRISRSLNEFSIEKNTFVHAVFDRPNYIGGLRAGLSRWPELMRCIAHRPGGMPGKVALTLMCLSILTLPRHLGMPIARYLCNPTARSN